MHRNLAKLTGSTIKTEIETATSVLVGMPLFGIGRAVDMAMLQFGAEHSELSRGELRTFGDYALHVQCPWRIVRDGVIVVGYSDMRVAPVGSDPETFDPDEGRTRRDDLTADFEGHGSEAHVVTSLEAANVGDLRLVLADGCVVEVLPDFATAQDDAYEYWRLFEPGSETQHFVVSAGRAEWQGTGAPF